jgi:hypothetical protein
MLGRYFTHTFSTMAHITSLSVETNMVDLDLSVKDAWANQSLGSRSSCTPTM